MKPRTPTARLYTGTSIHHRLQNDTCRHPVFYSVVTGRKLPQYDCNQESPLGAVVKNVCSSASTTSTALHLNTQTCLFKFTCICAEQTNIQTLHAKHVRTFLYSLVLHRCHTWSAASLMVT